MQRACEGDRTVTLTEDERDAAVHLLNSRGCSDPQIARRLGITARTVLRIRQRHDIPASVGGAA